MTRVTPRHPQEVSVQGDFAKGVFGDNLKPFFSVLFSSETPVRHIYGLIEGIGHQNDGLEGGGIWKEADGQVLVQYSIKNNPAAQEEFTRRVRDNPYIVEVRGFIEVPAQFPQLASSDPVTVYPRTWKPVQL